MFKTTHRIVLAAVLAVTLPGTAALACGFHGAVYGGLTIPYPGSLQVAISIAKARQHGVLAQTTGDARRRSFSAFHAAVSRLEDLKTSLHARSSAGAGTGVRQFSVLFVGSRLWSHYRLGETGADVTPHVAGPIDGSPVVLTDDSVLDAVLAGRLDVQEAFDLGLISVSGDTAGNLAKLLVASLKRTPQG